jgi:hypothetical protein
MIVNICIGLAVATSAVALVLLQIGASRSIVDILVGVVFGLSVPAILRTFARISGAKL